MSHSTLGRVSNPTLRVLADLPRQPVSLSESTLILIDCQNTYTRGVMELDGVQEALDEAAALLDRARSAGIPTCCSRIRCCGRRDAPPVSRWPSARPPGRSTTSGAVTI